MTFVADLEQGIGWIHRFNLFRVGKQANISTYMRAKMIKMVSLQVKGITILIGVPV